MEGWILKINNKFVYEIHSVETSVWTNMTYIGELIYVSPEES
jgi:hypothetical protein